MKKTAFLAILLCAVAAIIALTCEFGTNNADMGSSNCAYLRIHIRADSNGSEAQAVKYKVRDAVVAYLTPTVSECETKREAIEKIKGKLSEIERTAKNILIQNGYFYGARAEVRQETFPTRVYENVTLEAGVYDALILELGSGKGDNWWCVVYPPLCFSGGNGNVVYKSKIAEIIRKFFT